MHRVRVAHWASFGSAILHVRGAPKARDELGMRAAHRALRPDNHPPTPKLISNRLIGLQVSYPSFLNDSWICYGVLKVEKTSVCYGES